MAVIKIGSIGLGGISTGVHLPGIAESPDLQLCAVCDIDPERLKLIGDRYSIPENRRFVNYRQLIACPEVEAVDISTPNDVHFEIAMASVRAGKPFVCEKPLCMDSRESAELLDAVTRANVKAMVCFSYRYKAAARYAREIVSRGLLGKIYHADMQYAQAWGLPSANCPRVWRFSKERAGSGALGDLGSHGLDLVRFITGTELTSVVAQNDTFVFERPALSGNGMEKVDVDDVSNALAKMSNGGAASFRITRFAYGRGNYQRLEIYGDNGALVYELDAGGDRDDELYACLDPLGRETRDFTRLPIPYRHRKSQMQSFADILNGKPDGLDATISDAHINMLAVDAIIKSSAEGRRIEL